MQALCQEMLDLQTVKPIFHVRVVYMCEVTTCGEQLFVWPVISILAYDGSDDYDITHYSEYRLATITMCNFSQCGEHPLMGIKFAQN